MSLLSKAFGDIITFTRASAATRVNAQGLIESVAANVPRIDYDPVTLECKGLLIEEQRTNLEPYSNLSTDWAINYGAVVITPGQADPSGGSAAVRLDGSGSWSWGKTVSGLSAEGTYTGSFYIKADAAGAVDLQIFDGSTVTTISKPVTTQWTRIDGQKQIAGSVFRLAVAKSSSQSVTVAFAQVEAGSFATSYIPTAGSQVTRAADVASINALSPWFRRSEGAFVVEFLQPVGAEQQASAFDLWQDSANKLSARHAQVIYAVSAVTVGSDGGSFAQGGVHKRAVSYGGTGLAFARDGVLSLSGGSQAVIPAPVKIYLGVTDATLYYLNGYIRSLRYFPKRLSDAQLQALTA